MRGNPRLSRPDADTLLAEHDVECPSCGHNLRGLNIDLCPECGKPFDRASLAFVSPDLGLESITQTQFAMTVLVAANILMLLELRLVSTQATSPSTILAAVSIARGGCLLVAMLAALPCSHMLMGEPEVEHRRTTPRGWLLDMLSLGLANLPVPPSLYWRILWGATILDGVLWGLGQIL